MKLLHVCQGRRIPTCRKLISLLTAIVRVLTWKASGKKVVFTNGCFDVLHVGHVALLEAARMNGDRLIVAVNSDRAVKLLKGEHRPINPEKDRVRLVAALEAVDAVMVVDDIRMTNVISILRPNVWVKGGDYRLEDLDKGEVEVAVRVGARIAIIPSVPDVSTTALVKRLRG